MSIELQNVCVLPTTARKKKQEKKLIYNQFAKSFTLFRKVSCADAHDAL